MEDINLNPGQNVPFNDIQSRREARRRKILNNAKDRLEKLNGRVSSDDKNDGHTKSTSYRTFSDPEIETEELFGPKFPITNTRTTRSFDLNNSSGQAELENFVQLFSQMNQFSQNGSFLQEPNPLFTEMMGTQANMQREPEFKLRRFLKTKVHLFIISSLTYIFFSSGTEHFTTYSVFLPLLIWELTETFLFKTNNENINVLFSFAFMMSGISSKISNGLLKIIGTLNKIFQDVGIFTFFFVFCHIVCTFHLNNYYSDLQI